MKRLLFVVMCLWALTIPARAQKVAVQTNLLDWAALATINAEAQISFAQHYTFDVYGRYNPWTFGADSENPWVLQQRSVAVGVRYWPWYVYSGWWFSPKFIWREFNWSGVFTQNTTTGTRGEGLSLRAGYSLMVNSHFNIEFGAGVCGLRYSHYDIIKPDGSSLGNKGSQSFIQPDFLSVALVYVF